MTTDLKAWRRQVDNLLWFYFKPPLLEAEVEQYWECGLSPELTVERIINGGDRPKDGECQP